ncbi:MAG TPA: TIM44-like domain-containing protein [Solirubrobacteraceae bacterium]|nr:TIM44-like domain-containing protein [Solirubrobacteraceae bacterium]
MKRAIRILVLAVAVLALGAVAAYAGPGGGTSGFGGGGGGGGGGGFSGGGSSGGTGTGGTGGGIAFLIFVGAFFAFVIFSVVTTAFAVRRMRKRRAARERAVELAAAEAADDDAAFAADEVRGEAAALLNLIVKAWTARDRDALEQMLGPDLMVEWERRLDDFDRKGWHNVCEIVDGPKVQYLGLVNRADDADDRVTVRVESRQRDVVIDRNGNTITRSNQSEIVTVGEYWTLGKRDGRWILLSIEQEAEGAHHLDAEIVASPWGDEGRLHDEAVTELATAEALPAEQIAEVADLDFDGTARAAALDLAMVDGRFAPDVLEAAARQAVGAWAEAVDGDDAALERAATPGAVRELLYAGDASEKTRLVVRGPRLRALRITALHADAVPPAMTIEADVSGRRYREDRDTVAVVEGSKEREVTFTERWTMTLDGSSDVPWRIAETGSALRSA